jgi:uncharacterized protein YgiM (DUF1202 family)
MTIEKKIFDFTAWFMAGFTLLVILTSCSPYAAMSAIADTPTPAPSMTGTAKVEQLYNSPTPRPSCVVTAYTLNMRSAGTMSARVIQILERGEALTVLHGGAWLKVSTAGNVTGWVYGKYCR